MKKKIVLKYQQLKQFEIVVVQKSKKYFIGFSGFCSVNFCTESHASELPNKFITFKDLNFFVDFSFDSYKNL